MLGLAGCPGSLGGSTTSVGVGDTIVHVEVRTVAVAGAEAEVLQAGPSMLITASSTLNHPLQALVDHVPGCSSPMPTSHSQATLPVDKVGQETEPELGFTCTCIYTQHLHIHQVVGLLQTMSTVDSSVRHL